MIHCVALALLAAALPATAHAQVTGGTAPPQPEPPASGAPAGEGQPAGDMEVAAPRTAFVRRRVVIRGAARKARRKLVRVEQRRAGGAWALVARVRADRKGAFRVAWRPRRPGAYELRARVGAAANRAATGGTAVPLDLGAGGSSGTGYVTVYKPAIATWYGPGFFGRTTACGIELTQAALGVAHRTLPCGTEVQLAFRRRTIVVPVIDRGPFANNADWDLTQAAARMLGMTGTSRIGAMPLAPSR